MGKVCCCFGAGEFFGLHGDIPTDALIIAADAGIKTAEKCGIEPDIVVGDFDSLGYLPEARELVKLPVEKDQTDMAEAVDIGLERGCDEFLLCNRRSARPHSREHSAYRAPIRDRQKGLYLRKRLLSDGDNVRQHTHKRKNRRYGVRVLADRPFGARYPARAEILPRKSHPFEYRRPRCEQ